ncbi:MAG: adenosylcobinamide-GDP ribazoletransferase [Candidatus Bathyarchaeota archaeon]|nr:adenosylcobinamide-GDP ribazoletransferase [Candidatus Bathyarchaeota archaeon]MDH5532077.1 adenosylcobinamide-GDP ribazoletransferase [Candidatus Bathyarchaeota archaeon]MDH5712682.1 adenosylcobinamide-GDP ribazoletransferase [Candidatus Bathyarchaeota archaeon]
MFKEIKNLISFLTVIPVGMDPDCLTDAANYMYLFPAVGALVGLLAGLCGWLLSHVLSALIVGVLTLSVVLLITGLHHTDGLLDFGDGIMYQGSPEKKIEVMHDQLTGTGGLTLGLITILTTALCIAGLSMGIVIQSLIVSEVSAKLAMVIGIWVGKSAHNGMNTYFVNAMHGQHRNLRLTVALIVSLGIAIPLQRIVGFAAVVAGLATALVMVGVSNRHFKGITGDVMGATNELARMASLIMILAATKWA